MNGIGLSIICKNRSTSKLITDKMLLMLLSVQVQVSDFDSSSYNNIFNINIGVKPTE